MLLVFLSSFGRCWAGQYGLLTGTGWECCPCPGSATVDPFSGGQGHPHDHDDDQDHDCRSHEKGSDDQEIPWEEPASPVPQDCPCQVCELIESGFVLLTSTISVPEPLFPAARPAQLLVLDYSRSRPLGQVVDEPPVYRPPDDERSIFMCELVTSTSISVRGPDMK